MMMITSIIGPSLLIGFFFVKDREKKRGGERERNSESIWKNKTVDKKNKIN